MEIEAKFSITNAGMARQLRGLNRIGEFTLGAPERVSMRDTFFDTRTHDLLNTRHVLRIRQRSDGQTLMTFKGPAERAAAIHRRPETEIKIAPARVPHRLAIAEIPLRIRKLVSPLVRETDLVAMFAISQVRSVRTVQHGRRTIGEWSLDLVRFRAGERKRAFYELEIELKKTGTEAELQSISEWLAAHFALPPQSEGKFARALKFMRGDTA